MLNVPSGLREKQALNLSYMFVKYEGCNNNNRFDFRLMEGNLDEAKRDFIQLGLNLVTLEGFYLMKLCIIRSF